MNDTSSNTFVFIMKDQLDQLGTSRVSGVRIKEKAEEILKLDENQKLIFDFNGVDYVSTGFSKELFGELFKTLGRDFGSKIVIHVGDNKILKETILRALHSVI